MTRGLWTVRSPEIRRRVRLTALLALVSLAFGIAAATPAHAVTYDMNQLPIGVQTTVTPQAWGDVIVYHLTAPADQRLTLSAAPSTSPVMVSLAVFDDNAPTPFPIATSYQFGNVPWASPFLDVDPSTTSRTLTIRIQVIGPGILPITAGLVTDPPPVTIGWKAPTTATIAAPGEMASLSFPGVPGHRLGVLPLASTLSGSGGLSLWLRAADSPGGDQPLTQVGTASGTYLMRDTTYSILAKGNGSTGTVTIEIFDVTDTTGPLTLGASTSLRFDSPWDLGRMSFTEVPGTHLRLDVESVNLTHSDGSPGTATAALSPQTAAAETLGTISSAPATFYLPRQSSTALSNLLLIGTDGLSTGTIIYRLTAVPDYPPTPITSGTTTVAAIDTPYRSRLYTFDATVGQRFTVTVDQASLTALDGNPGLVYIWAIAPDGTLRDVLYGEYGPTSQPYTLPFTADVTGSWTLKVSGEGAVGTVTLAITALRDVSVPLTLDGPVTATATSPTDALFFTYPGAVGATTPTLTLSTVSLTDSTGAPGSARIALQQNGTNLATFTSTPGYSFTAPPQLDPTRPWRLTAFMVGSSTGSIAVMLLQPTITNRVVRPGAATRVTFRGVSDSTNLTFTPEPGRRIVVRTSRPAFGVAVELRTTKGAVLGSQSMTSGYAEFPAATSDQSLTLAMRPVDSTVYPTTMDVSLLLVNDPVITTSGPTRVRWTLGQNPLLSFDGVKGRRISLDLVGGADMTGPVALSVVDPNGVETALPYALFPGTSSYMPTDIVLPSSGRYGIRLDPYLDAVGSLTATVNQIKDLQITTTLGRTVTLPFTQPGQRAQVSLRLTTPSSVDWQLSDGVPTGEITMRAPDGTWVGYSRFDTATRRGTFWGGVLPAGNYTVLVNPDHPLTGTTRLKLSATP